jgi:hypothetical protein
MSKLIGRQHPISSQSAANQHTSMFAYNPPQLSSAVLYGAAAASASASMESALLQAKTIEDRLYRTSQSLDLMGVWSMDSVTAAAAAERRHGIKRPAEDTDGPQRLAKRFDRMNLGQSHSSTIACP